MSPKTKNTWLHKKYQIITSNRHLVKFENAQCYKNKLLKLY